MHQIVERLCSEAVVEAYWYMLCMLLCLPDCPNWLQHCSSLLLRVLHTACQEAAFLVQRILFSLCIRYTRLLPTSATYVVSVLCKKPVTMCIYSRPSHLFCVRCSVFSFHLCCKTNYADGMQYDCSGKYAHLFSGSAQSSEPISESSGVANVVCFWQFVCLATPMPTALKTKDLALHADFEAYELHTTPK